MADGGFGDGLLVLPGDAAARTALGVRDDRDDLFVLHDVASGGTLAHAVVRRTGVHAALTRLVGPRAAAGRLLDGVADALRRAGTHTLTGAPGGPVPL